MIFIKSDSVSPNSVKVTTEDGSEITGITRIDIVMSPFEDVKAMIEVLVGNLDILAEEEIKEAK